MKMLIIAFALASQAGARVEFSGTWTFAPGKSQNVSMMAAMEWTATLSQSEELLVEEDATTFAGQHQTREVRYDLKGRATKNPGPMGEDCVTRTSWDGRSLKTTWTSEGAVMGTTVQRVETRSLSPDGKTMTVESRRGDSLPLVMVFERK